MFFSPFFTGSHVHSGTLRVRISVDAGSHAGRRWTAAVAVVCTRRANETYETPELLEVHVRRFRDRFQRVRRGRRSVRVQLDADPFRPETVQRVHDARPLVVVRAGLHVEHSVQVERRVRRAVRFARSKKRVCEREKKNGVTSRATNEGGPLFRVGRHFGRCSLTFRIK